MTVHARHLQQGSAVDALLYTNTADFYNDILTPSPATSFFNAHTLLRFSPLLLASPPTPSSSNFLTLVLQPAPCAISHTSISNSYP